MVWGVATATLEGNAVESVLVTIWPDAGKALGLGRSKMFELVEKGEIVSVRVGRRRLIPAAALHAYAERLLAEQCA